MSETKQAKQTIVASGEVVKKTIPFHPHTYRIAHAIRGLKGESVVRFFDRLVLEEFARQKQNTRGISL